MTSLSLCCAAEIQTCRPRSSMKAELTGESGDSIEPRIVADRNVRHILRPMTGDSLYFIERILNG